MSGRVIRSAGFTLVEVVVALTLVSVIMLGLMTALGTFANTSSRLERRAFESDDVRLVYAFLQQSLGAASARSRSRAEDSVQTTWFTGGEDHLEWLGMMPARHGVGGLYHLRLARDPEVARDGLVLEYLPYTGDEYPPEWGRGAPHVLLEGATGFSIAYRRLGSLHWLRQWEDPLVLPGYVRLRISLKEMMWPVLVVHVLASEPGTDVGEPEGAGGGSGK